LSDKSKGMKISPQVLRSHFESVMFACSKDEFRPQLSGVYLVIQDKEIKTVGTNGHQLAVKTSYLDEPVLKEKIEVIIPQNALSKVIGKLTGKEKIDVGFSDNYAWFSFGSDELYARLIQDKYVNFDNVIPATFKHEITIDRDSLYSTVKRLGVFTDVSNRLVALTFGGGKVQIRVVDENNGNEGVETMVCDYSGDQLVRLGFNAFYLKEMLHHVESDKVIFKFNEPAQPVVLSQTGTDAGSYLLLIMPMRIEEDQETN